MLVFPGADAKGRVLMVEAGAVALLVPYLQDHDLYTRTNAAGALMSLAINLTGKLEALEGNILPLLVNNLDQNFDTLLINVLQCMTTMAEHPQVVTRI